MPRVLLGGRFPLFADLWNEGRDKEHNTCHGHPEIMSTKMIGCQPWVPTWMSSLLCLTMGRCQSYEPVGWAPSALWLHSHVGESWRLWTASGIPDQGHQLAGHPSSCAFLMPLPCLAEIWMPSHKNLCPLAWRTTMPSMTCGGRAMCLWSSTTRIQRRNR